MDPFNLSIYIYFFSVVTYQSLGVVGAVAAKLSSENDTERPCTWTPNCNNCINMDCFPYSVLRELGKWNRTANYKQKGPEMSNPCINVP